MSAGGQQSAVPAVAATIAGAAGAFLWSTADAKLYGDARFADLYGLDREAAAAGLPTNAFFTAIHPDDRMRIRIAVAGVMHGADIFSKEYRLPTPDGSVRWVSAAGSAERDADLKVVTFSGVVTDITDRKRMEERLSIAQSAGGVGTFEYVSGFGTVDVSHQFCRLLGLTPTDALALRTVNAVLVPKSALLIGDLEDYRKPGLFYREFQIVRPDTGETRWIGRRGEHRSDGPGGATRFVGAIYDITPFKTVEANFQHLTATLENRVAEQTAERNRVWNNSRDLLAVLHDGVFRDVNPAWTRVLGYPTSELIGRDYFEFVVPDDVSSSRTAMAEAPQALNVKTFENRIKRHDGSFGWFSWQTSFEDGQVYAYGRDVTDDKRRVEALRLAEDQLRQAQKMEAVGQLTGGLAHDFNNMLTGIIGGLEIIRRHIAKGRLKDIDRFMEGATTSAKRAAALTHRLLAFSRQQSLDPQAIDVIALMRSMEDLLSRTLGEQVILKVAANEGVWGAVSDINQLENALLNLAINARDAMPDGGLLTIGASNVVIDPAYVDLHPDASVGEFVAITVTDTGIGMPPDIVAKAFDPFFTTKPVGQGTGLGLSMIYGFVRQSGGHAAIQSAPGQGTSVTIYLPRAAQSPPAPQLAPETHEIQRGAGQNILVVEDEDSVRVLIVEALTELGYVTLQACNSDTALPFLQSEARIDLMITDVGLPGLNGRQLADIARSLRPDLNVLFVTGYAANASIRANFLGAGMDMIAKPFAIDDLAARVGKMAGFSAASSA
jgi:PAS domain S-box-containing protein